MPNMNKIGRTNTAVYSESGFTHVRYHNTAVVSFNDRQINLRTGGWTTNTTKNRMNQTSNQFNLGFRVFQRNGSFHVQYKGSVFAFNGDNVTLDRETGMFYPADVGDMPATVRRIKQQVSNIVKRIV
jgi:hypothetical protein